MATTAQTCIVSGTGGYLGSRVKAAFEQQMWQVRELTRFPKPGSQSVQFQLGGEIDARCLEGAEALVHCAYDFGRLSWPEIHRVNVSGTEKLLRAARQAGVERLIYISSTAAFEGCRSLYGKAKLETEKIARSLGADVIRPGLIWGSPPGAIFASLVGQVRSLPIVPLPAGNSVQVFLVNDQDLSSFILDCAGGKIRLPDTPVTLANEEPLTFGRILEEIARAESKKRLFVSVPWQPFWAAIKAAELCGLRLKFRSDSLVSLNNQNPSFDFAPMRKLQVNCRPFPALRGT